MSYKYYGIVLLSESMIQLDGPKSWLVSHVLRRLCVMESAGTDLLKFAPATMLIAASCFLTLLYSGL